MALDGLLYGECFGKGLRVEDDGGLITVIEAKDASKSVFTRL